MLKNFTRCLIVISFLITSISAFADRPMPHKVRSIEVNEDYERHTLRRSKRIDWFVFSLPKEADKVRVRVKFRDHKADVDVKLFEVDHRDYELSKIGDSRSTDSNERLTEYDLDEGLYFVKIYVYNNEWEYGNHIAYRVRVEADYY